VKGEGYTATTHPKKTGILLALTMLVIWFVPGVTYAQPSGTFSGPSNMQSISCTSPPSGTSLGTHTITVTIVSDSVTVNVSGPDFSYSGSGTLTETSPNIFGFPLSTSSFNVTGSLIPPITGGSESVSSADIVFGFDPPSNSLVVVGFMLRNL